MWRRCIRWLIDWFRPEFIGGDAASIVIPPPMRRIVAPDESAVLDVHAGPGALFHFVEWTLIPADEHGDAYLSPTRKSGFYVTAAEAEADARRAIAWLRDLPAMPPPAPPSR